jgi:Zn-dependent M28 family amino/carboxypeptidase
VTPDAAATAPDAAVPDAAQPQAPADPLALAGEVRQETLAEHIEALAALGTRFTYSDGDERARDLLVDRLGALGYETELDAFRFAGEDAENIIARKVGVTTPDVVYIFSAHYDSTSESPETSAPGADDNASGVAAVLEAARVLADVPLESSVWFVLTAAEEQGSVGSAHLARRLKTERTDVRGVIAPDMIGYWPLGDDDALDLLGDMGSVALVDRMAALADALGVPYKRFIEHEYCYGDDHTNFQEAGFPAISPMDCVEAHNIPASGETLGHYHRSSDTLETLHLPFTTRVAGLIVATLADLAVPAAR